MATNYPEGRDPVTGAPIEPTYGRDAPGRGGALSFIIAGLVVLGLIAFFMMGRTGEEMTTGTVPNANPTSQEQRTIPERPAVPTAPMTPTAPPATPPAGGQQ